MASGSKSPTPGGEAGPKLDAPMPNGQTRMTPVKPTPPQQPVQH